MLPSRDPVGLSMTIKPTVTEIPHSALYHPTQSQNLELEKGGERKPVVTEMEFFINPMEWELKFRFILFI